MNVACDDSTMLPFIIILTFCCTIPTKNLHQLYRAHQHEQEEEEVKEYNGAGSSSSSRQTIRSSLCTVRVRGERNRCVSFVRIAATTAATVAAAAAAAAEHFYTRICFLCRPHWSCHCWHIYFSTFLSRYFVFFNWCVSFCCPFLFLLYLLLSIIFYTFACRLH